MLQRIQTVYLLLAVLLSGGLAFFLPFWNESVGVPVKLADMLNGEDNLLRIVPFLFMVSGILSLVTLFLFKNRTRQIIYNRLNIVINFLLLGIVVYHLLMLSGEANVSEKGIGAIIPLVVIVLLALANKAIIKDDKLVKSVDRLR
ncbi:DUF4293 domain-containing protein [Lutimonas saemankumensis]|uniref:DUF4293 domain-containing protein n=1 Tax=Lutimonas saemankumensis TaxID=483016 RepID=UPI001CD65C7C|nr:DUF4293 domain-containing protein [Lutimonas saemankumensis]MCA0930972.1 DUF4293 domain-containing protein [Lutimonas saemankumensis]